MTSRPLTPQDLFKKFRNQDIGMTLKSWITFIYTLHFFENLKS